MVAILAGCSVQANTRRACNPSPLATLEKRSPRTTVAAGKHCAIRAANAGSPVVVRGQVTDIDGKPLPGATVDFWQNADNGMYWQQDDTQPQDNLRCQMKVAADGCFELVTTRPQPYMVPTDGPVGELLRTSHRDAWRPAHFHVIVEAPGYRSLITEVFDSADPYVESDAVFGVRESLVAHFRTESDAEVARRYKLPASYLAVDLPIRLARQA